MYKRAFLAGRNKALVELGLAKLANQMEDPSTRENEGQQQGDPNQNPAELLASIFQQAEIPISTPSPDNRTKPEKNEGKKERGIQWGNPVSGPSAGLVDRLGLGYSEPSLTNV